MCGLNATVPMPVLLIGPCLSLSLAFGLLGTAEKEQPHDRALKVLLHDVSLWEQKFSSHPVSPNYKVKIIPFYSLLNRTAPGKQKQTLVIALCPWSP